MKALSVILIFSFLISSCSNLQSVRNPAAEILQTQEKVLQVFQFRSSNIKVNADLTETIQSYINDYLLFSSTHTVNFNEVKVEFVEDSTLPKDVAYFPEFYVKDNTYRIIVFHSPGAIHDPVASGELFNFFKTMKNEKYFKSIFSAFEMYYNAIEQDPIAIYNWAKIRQAAAETNANFVVMDAGAKELADRGEEWRKEKEDYNVIAKQALKEQKKKDLERRVVIDALDKASEDAQFKTLVARNDRKGAAALLRKYLPWEQMAPFEKRYWETYLEVLVKPVPMEKRIFIYRGIDDDFIYSAHKDGKELGKEVARKDGDVFIMSSIITKNQGTWNRRLRSLTSMNDKFIGTDINLNDEFTKSSRIVTMFNNHSLEPKGSPFLSLTPSYQTARGFGYIKISAYALDPRLISYNFASIFKKEVEFLLPLMTFPEDIVAYYDAEIHKDIAVNENILKDMFKEKLLNKYGNQKGEEIFNSVMKNSEEYFDSAINRYHGNQTAAIFSDMKPFKNFYNQIFEKKIIPIPAADAPKGTAACIDIITHFWKK
jgi:hypothetical protein